MGTKYYNSYSEMVEDKPVAGTKGVVHPISLVMEFDGTKWGSAGGGSVLSESEWIKLGEYYTTVDSSVTGIDNTYTVANAISALDAAITDIKTDVDNIQNNSSLETTFNEKINPDYSTGNAVFPLANAVDALINKNIGYDQDIVTIKANIEELQNNSGSGVNSGYITTINGITPATPSTSVTLTGEDIKVSSSDDTTIADKFNSFNITTEYVTSVNEITPVSGNVQIYGTNIHVSSEDSTSISDAIVRVETLFYSGGKSLSSRMDDAENAISGGAGYSSHNPLDSRMTALENGIYTDSDSLISRMGLVENAIRGTGSYSHTSSLDDRMGLVENAIRGTGSYSSSESLDTRVTNLEGDSGRITTLETTFNDTINPYYSTSNTVFPLADAVDALIDRISLHDQDFITVKADIEELKNNSGGSSGSTTVGSKTDDITITIGTGSDNPGVGYQDENGYYIDGVTGSRMPTGWAPPWNESTTLSEALSIIAYRADAAEQSNVDFRPRTVQMVNNISPDTSTTDGAVTITGADIKVSSSDDMTIADKFNSFNNTEYITSVNGVSSSSYGSSDITITGQDIAFSSSDSYTIYDKIGILEGMCFKLRMNGEELSYTSQDENGYNCIDLYSPRIEEINIENLSIYSSSNGAYTSLYDVIENLNISIDTRGGSTLFLPADNVMYQHATEDIINALATMGVDTSYNSDSNSYYPYVVDDIITALINKASSSVTVPDWSNLTTDGYGFVNNTSHNNSGDGGGSVSGTLSATTTYSAIVPFFLIVQKSQENEGFSVVVNGNTVFSDVKNCCILIGAGDYFSIGNNDDGDLEIKLVPLK